MNRTGWAAASIGFICLAAACGSETKGGGGDHPTPGTAHLDPSSFVATVDNPYFPLTPGTVWEYEATEDTSKERVVVTVLDKTKVVDGVTATVVHDLVTKAGTGTLVEDTYDWYAQDKKGNVWYLGENTKAYDGKKVDTHGSWEAAVGGARPGLLMVAEPKVGRTYRQEYLKGEAEDVGKVIATGDSVRGPTGTYDRVVGTEDTTPLEPDLVEHKWYAPGVGIVQEADIKGGNEKVALVKFSKP